MFVDYNYGCYKKEVKVLLRKRLSLKEKLRYHEKKIEELSDKLNVIEHDIKGVLDIAKL